MGRIGQSLIMPGQPPYCSLFSVWRADERLHVRRHTYVRVCMQLCTVVRWDKGAAGKKSPYLISSTTTHPLHAYLTSMPLQIGFYITEAVRYEQVIFLSLFWLFLSFIPPPHLLTSGSLGISFSRSLASFIPSVACFFSQTMWNVSCLFQVDVLWHNLTVDVYSWSDLIWSDLPLVWNRDYRGNITPSLNIVASTCLWRISFRACTRGSTWLDASACYRVSAGF